MSSAAWSDRSAPVNADGRSSRPRVAALADGECLARLGLLGLLLVVVLDLVVAWALHDVLAPALPGAARLVAWL